MPIGLVVEEFGFEIDVTICGKSYYANSPGNLHETTEQIPRSREETITEIRQLIEVKKLSIEAVAQRIKLSLAPVRRICRRLGLGRYAPGQSAGTRVSRSSQIPFGWSQENGILIENASEMRWVKIAKDLRANGLSYQAIARYFNEKGVPTKNGGRWHAKTVLQILKFNS